MTELSSVMRNCAEARVRRTIPPGEFFPRPSAVTSTVWRRQTARSVDRIHCHQASVSGCGDLNPGPPAPKAGALPSCATSRAKKRIIHSLFCYPLGSAVFITLLQQITLSWQADQRSQDTVHEPRRRASTARVNAARAILPRSSSHSSTIAVRVQRVSQDDRHGDAANQLPMFLRKSVTRNEVAKYRPRARRVDRASRADQVPGDRGQLVSQPYRACSPSSSTSARSRGRQQRR